MSKNQPFHTFETTKKLNLDRYVPLLLKLRRPSGTKLSQFAVPKRTTHSKVKESRFARDKQISRECMRVNSDFLDPSQGKIRVHCASPVRLIVDRNYCAKLLRVLLFRL